MSENLSRRRFISTASAAGVAVTAPTMLAANGKPVLLGGAPACRVKEPAWPVFDGREEKGLLEVVRSGCWFRGNGKQVSRFESAYAQLTGAKGCLATVNGTNALFISLNAVGVEAGDEVLLPPFTFVATVNVVLRQHALPVFVDTDVETFQLDTTKLEGLVNERTRAIMPVHLGGSPANLDGVLDVARKHKLAVVEDACQAWVAQWKGRNVGNWGDTGCFSFQASKNLNAGEGGAIISSNADIIERCYSFHNQGRTRGGSSEFSYSMSGSNLRMTEFQAAILQAQLTRLEEHNKRREENAAYLAGMLKEIPGVTPAKMYEGCTRNAYHLFMMRYDKTQFAGLPRDRFLRALNAEGVPFKSGYGKLNQSAFLKKLPESRSYRALFPKQRLAQWLEQLNTLPNNDRAAEEACWMLHWNLLHDRGVMEQFAEGVRKVHAHAAALARA